MTNLQPWQLAEFMYQMGQATAALIEMEAMKAENMQRQHLGQSMAYTDKDFMKLQEDYGMHHNPLTEAMRRINQ